MNKNNPAASEPVSGTGIVLFIVTMLLIMGLIVLSGMLVFSLVGFLGNFLSQYINLPAFFTGLPV